MRDQTPPFSRQPAGFALTGMLVSGTLLSLGLLLASLFPASRAASGSGTIAFFPMMFFAGLWLAAGPLALAVPSGLDDGGRLSQHTGPSGHSFQAAAGAWLLVPGAREPSEETADVCDHGSESENPARTSDAVTSHVAAARLPLAPHGR